MSKHLFGMILTHQGTYANNRGENEGNASTLQKVLRNGELYTTVSSESIRYAIREGWQVAGHSLNRKIIDHRTSSIQDRAFSAWWNYLDDDALGFMHAREETLSRRGLLEITRAISLTPWRGEIMHNFASPGSNPSVTDNVNPIPYAVEVHDTRYQFGFALTPEFFGCAGFEPSSNLSGEEKVKRLGYVLDTLGNLRREGGNHARYLADYSPEAIVLRWTDDPAPRFLYCFEQKETGDISLEPLLTRIEGEDIDAKEIIIGTSLNIAWLRSKPEEKKGRGNSLPPRLGSLADAGVLIVPGVKKAVDLLKGKAEKFFGSQPNSGE